MCIDQRASSIHLAYDRNGKIVPIKFSEATHKVFDIPPGGQVIVHEVGCRPMSAELALDYARIRYGLPKTRGAIGFSCLDRGVLRGWPGDSPPKARTGWAWSSRAVGVLFGAGFGAVAAGAGAVLEHPVLHRRGDRDLRLAGGRGGQPLPQRRWTNDLSIHQSR